MWSNTYVKTIIIALIAMVFGVVLGYFYKDSKVVVKTEQVLVKGKTVKVETPGKTITTTVWDSKTDSYEKTEINKKRVFLEVGALTDKSIYAHLSVNVIGPFLIGAHAAYQPLTRTTIVGGGIGVAF